MRKRLAVLALVLLIPVGVGTLSGCGSDDAVLENDPKVSEAKRVEYETQMKEQLQKNMPQKGKRK